MPLLEIPEKGVGPDEREDRDVDVVADVPAVEEQRGAHGDERRGEPGAGRAEITPPPVETGDQDDASQARRHPRRDVAGAYEEEDERVQMIEQRTVIDRVVLIGALGGEAERQERMQALVVRHRPQAEVPEPQPERHQRQGQPGQPGSLPGRHGAITAAVPVRHPKRHGAGGRCRGLSLRLTRPRARGVNGRRRATAPAPSGGELRGGGTNRGRGRQRGRRRRSRWRRRRAIRVAALPPPRPTPAPTARCGQEQGRGAGQDDARATSKAVCTVDSSSNAIATADTPGATEAKREPVTERGAMSQATEPDARISRGGDSTSQASRSRPGRRISVAAHTPQAVAHRPAPRGSATSSPPRPRAIASVSRRSTCCHHVATSSPEVTCHRASDSVTEIDKSGGPTVCTNPVVATTTATAKPAAASRARWRRPVTTAAIR